MKLKPMRPGVKVMRLLRLPTKLTILSLVLIVPLIVISTQLVLRLNESIDVTQAEIKGSGLVQVISNVITEVQKHRGQTNMVLSGNGNARAALEETQGRLNASLAQVDVALADAGELGLASEWKDLRQALADLKSTERLDAASAFLRHSEQVHQLSTFMYTVAERTNLLFDPEAATYFLMDMAVSHTTKWGELLGQIRGMGAGMLASGDRSEHATDRLEALLSEAQTETRDMQYKQGFLRKYGQDDLKGDVAIQDAQAFLALVPRLVKEHEGMTATDYFAAGTRAVEAVSAYEKRVQERLQLLLESRVDGDRQQRTVSVLAVVVGLCLVVYLLLSFYFSFVIDFRHALEVMRETASGNLRAHVKIRGRDELAELTGLLEQMNGNLSGMVAEVRSNSALVAHSGRSLALGNRELADRTEQQAANL
ncbi:MAG: nitrate- and nitrite sensing domain-containing protein, partial [Hydrogenophaga sp.]|nr:nitrate- and nitrite sensing domain-containing protein [Hydrogenophaga sp.]